MGFWLASIVTAAPSSAASIPPVSAPALAPSSEWIAASVNGRCVLRRSIGIGAEQRTLTIAATPGQLPLEAEIATASVLSRRPARIDISLLFSPSANRVMIEANVWKIPNGSRVEFDLDRETLGDVAAAERIDVSTADLTGMNVSTGGMRDAVAIIRTCERNLLMAWQVDPDSFRPAVRRGQPGSFDPYPQMQGQLYPPAALWAKAQGRVTVLLRVEPNGRVAQCSVTTSSGNAALDAKPCSLAKDIRYPIVRNSESAPIVYWATLQMRFILPR